MAKKEAEVAPVKAEAAVKAEVEAPEMPTGDDPRKDYKIRMAGKNPEDKRYSLWKSAKDCTYCEDGREYEAILAPLPTNKYELIDVPDVTDVNAEFQKIAKLPIDRQAAELANLHKRMMTPVKALHRNGEIKRLTEYKGVLMYALEVNGRVRPCAEVHINMSAKKEEPRWVIKAALRPEGEVPQAASGDKSTPYFRL